MHIHADTFSGPQMSVRSRPSRRHGLGCGAMASPAPPGAHRFGVQVHGHIVLPAERRGQRIAIRPLIHVHTCAASAKALAGLTHNVVQCLLEVRNSFPYQIVSLQALHFVEN